MKKNLKQCSLLIIFFQCFLSVDVRAQKYLQIGFTNSENIPTAEENGKITDKNELIWSTYHLSCNDKNLESLLSNYYIVDFRPEYPLAKKFNDPNADLLSRVYRIIIIDGDEEKLKDKILNLASNAVDNVFVTYSAQSLAGANPNDYHAAPSFNDVYGYGAARQYLDLINVKKGWEYTRGQDNISIGIIDINFLSHTDLDAKVKNINSLGTPLTPNGYPHGIFVAGVAAAIPDNNTGIAGVGYNVSLRYYDMGHDFGTIPNYQNLLNGYSKVAYTGMMQAALDGCKVINCSWHSNVSLSTAPPINNDYNQKVINMITNMGITIVAAAGNHTTSTGDGYVYPASYENVISVAAVGCSYPLSAQYKTRLLGEDVPMLNFVKDCHERVLGYPNGAPSKKCGSIYNTFEHNKMVDICAPAYAIHTLTGGNSSNFSTDGGNDGTSMASPMVAGAAALLYSLNPNFKPSEIENYLKLGAADIYNLNYNGVYPNAKYLNLLGSGRLDVGKSVKLVNDNDNACMPKINDIVWSIAGSTITNNDYVNFNTIDFEIANSKIPSSSELEWEFISGNDIVKKVGDKVSINLGIDFSYFVGPYERVHTFPLEVYVRQKNTSVDGCVSAFYKEVGYSASVSGGVASEEMPYPSEICNGNLDGTVVLDRNDLLAGDIKGRNIYFGKTFFDPTATTEISTNDNLINAAASREVRMLPGFHINRPTYGNHYWTNSCEPAPTFFQYYSYFRAFISDDCQVPSHYRTIPKKVVQPLVQKTNNQLNNGILKSEYLTQKAANLRMYPNPATNNLTLEVFNNTSSYGNIYIVDLNGKVITQIKKYFDKGIQRVEIPINDLTKGLYIVKIQIGNTETVHKFIKN